MHGRFSSLAVAERLWRHSEQILQTCNPFSFDLVCFLHGYCWTIIRRLSLFLHLFFCAKIYHELCKTLPCESVCPWSVCVAWKMTRIDKICARRSPILSHQYAPLGTLLRSCKSVAISAVRFRSSASWRAARCCKSP